MSDPLQERGRFPSASRASLHKNCAASWSMEQLARDAGQAVESNQWTEYGERIHLSLHTGATEHLQDAQERMDYQKLLRERRLALTAWGDDNADIILMEKRLWLHHGIYPIFSGQGDYMRVQGRRGLILDYKSLWNKVAEPAENDQLKDLAILMRCHFPEVEQFTANILSPHYKYQFVVWTAAEVDEFAKELHERLERLRRKNETTPGDWCAKCPGKLICPAIKREAVDFIKGGVTELPLGTGGARILSELGRLKKLIEDAEEFYKLEINKDPLAVPGWGLKPGAEVRLMKAEEAFTAIRSMAPDWQPWDAVTVSVPKLEAGWEELRKRNETLPAFEVAFKAQITKRRNAASLVKVRRQRQLAGTNDLPELYPP